FGIFINAFSKEYGWGMGALSAAFSVGAIGGGVLGPLVGYLVDRFGPRLVMMIAVVLTGVAFLLVRFVNSLGLFYLLFGFLLPVATGPVFIGGSAAVANWFHRRRAFALSILTTAWVAGGAVIAPSSAWLVNHLGWQQTATIFGLVYLVTALPLCLVIRHMPEPYGYLPDGDLPNPESPSNPGQVGREAGGAGQADQAADFTLAQAVKTRAFWMLALAGIGLSMTNSSVTAHQVPLLTHRGFTPQTAANALGLMALFSAVGRPFMGYLGDRYDKRLLLGGFLAMMAAGILVLGLAQSMGQVYLYALLYGVGFAVFPVTMAMVADYFGRRFFATIQQTIQAIGVLGFASGPFLVGRLFDATNEYRVAFMGVSAVCLVTAILYLFSRKPGQQRLPQQDSK
ncbi:MAG: MFS transporter, partial [Dehalococcoidia bacterium]|nr:MFS transporter [Dehalococcoidia bacterium]